MTKTRTPMVEPSQGVDLMAHLSLLQDQAQRLARTLGARDPEDLAGEVLVRLLHLDRAGKLPDFRSIEELTAYTRVMTRNLVRDHSRRRPLSGDPMSGEPIQGGLPTSDAFIPAPEPIESALPARRRLSIVLRDRLGFSYEVLAGVLEHPSTGAAQRFHARSLAMLREGA